MNAEELAGFLVAHTLMVVANQDSQVVMHAHLDAGGQNHAERLNDGRLTRNISIGHHKLLHPPKDAVASVLVYNCLSRHFPMPEFSRGDLIVVEIKYHQGENKSIVFGVWYDGLDFVLTPRGDLLLNSFSFFFNNSSLTKTAFKKSFVQGFSDHEFGSRLVAGVDFPLETLNEADYGSECFLFFSKVRFGHDEILRDAVSVADFAEKYDDYLWHVPQDGIPAGRDETSYCVHIGVLLMWCLLNDMGGVNHADHMPDIKRMYMRRDSSPGRWCLDYAQGRLANKDLNDEGNLFVKSYHENYMGDFFDALPDDDAYSVQDSWEIYDIVVPFISRAYEEWRNERKKKHG